MIHNHLIIMTHHDSQPLAQHSTAWFTTCYDELVVVYLGVLCWVRGCESSCVMLSQSLWIMVCYAEPVVVNHGEWWMSEWLSMIHNQWVSITHHDSQPLAQHSTPWFTTTRSFITHHDSQPLAQINTPWFTNTGWAMMSQWLWIVLSYGEPVVMNNGVLYLDSGCDSWCAMLRQLLWIMVCYSEPVVVNHKMHNHWHSINTMIHNHWLSIAHYDSQPQAQNNTPWFTTTGKYHNSLWLTTTRSFITHHDSQPLAQHSTPWFTTAGPK
jgi:hypothetical protein